ncbi:flagellar hook-basal body complex protein [Gemmobacter sp.]|uniref:flagellar hook-basal body complex protein n=1 Tax=Gemmobacter sp. TaxID=1898957 RepID=UPI002AFE6F47|nr:flagellar hook-basal body complex protein [Gemmobacter sp.]
MDNAIYAALTRQSGLMREMQVVANNLANMATTGFRREGVVFSEYVKSLDGAPSLSMARASARAIDLSPGDLTQTGGTYDFAIQGEGFFLIETPEGERLSRAGHFTPGPEGELLNPDGFRLLDQGGAPVVVPPGTRSVMLARDGTLSADGLPVARIGLWQPADPTSLRHVAGTLFSADAPEPMEDGGTILQGHLEGANTDPITEVARMIEVQRAYEMGQQLLDREDQRIRNVLQTLGR